MNSMKVNILFFGQAKELSGTRQHSILLNENSTLHDCKLLLESEFPKLIELNSYAFAVNKDYIRDMNYILTDEDELALLPPVSGG